MKPLLMKGKSLTLKLRMKEIVMGRTSLVWRKNPLGDREREGERRMRKRKGTMQQRGGWWRELQRVL